jgi:hypothetical protein
MKRILSVLIGVSFLSTLGSAKDTFPGGIVYGPKAAFKIDAPKGWCWTTAPAPHRACPASCIRKVQPARAPTMSGYSLGGFKVSIFAIRIFEPQLPPDSVFPRFALAENSSSTAKGQERPITGGHAKPSYAAKSKTQQMAAGAALAAKRGQRSKSSLKGASKQMVKSMSEKQLRDFAKTKRKSLPRKKR